MTGRNTMNVNQHIRQQRRECEQVQLSVLILSTPTTHTFSTEDTLYK